MRMSELDSGSGSLGLDEMRTHSDQLVVHQYIPSMVVHPSSPWSRARKSEGKVGKSGTCT